METIAPVAPGQPAQQAAASAEAALRYCVQPVSRPRQLPPDITEGRARALLTAAKKWLNGTVLHYYFFDSAVDQSPQAWTAPDREHAVVRQAFDTWRGLGIGLRFVEVQDASEAEIRIGFDQGDGSWSYVGRDVLELPVSERTMNFGWPLADDDYGTTTALHEIGHTLGLPHEHQNPFAGIVWDEEAVYAHLGKPPNNWPRETTFHNVLRKLDLDSVTGSSWDPDSIMEYSFPAGLIVEPVAYRGGVRPPGTLSAADQQYVCSWYPGQGGLGDLPLLRPFSTVPVQLQPGQQVDYRLEPDGTRTYTIATFGQSDSVLGLFESVDGQLRFVQGDDDGGEDRNARISIKLFKGRSYVVRVRCYYAEQSATTAVMYW